MKKSERLTVSIPEPTQDQPQWLKVGIVAVVGFAVGVAWPKLAGVRLGPNAPSTTAASPAESASANGRAAAEAPAASLPAPVAANPTTPPSSAAPASASGAEPGGPTAVTVKPGIVLTCRTESGESLKGKACGAVGFDTVALPKLKRLIACPAAAGNEGKLSPQFHLDFDRNKITIQMGTKNTVGNIDSFSACLGGAFEKVSLSAIAHEHPKYSVLYNVVFAPGEAVKGSAAVATATPSGGTPAGGTGGNPAPAKSGDSTAKIAWDVAVVRDTPRTGAITGRLPRDTEVQIVSTENNWYRVKAGSTEGWVYRGAIGR